MNVDDRHRQADVTVVTCLSNRQTGVGQGRDMGGTWVGQGWDRGVERVENILFGNWT